MGKRNEKMEAALDLLAAEIPNGALLSCTDQVGFVVAVRETIAALRAELAKQQAVVEAVKEKCRDVLRFRPNTDNVAMDFDLDGARSMARWVLRTLDGEP